MNFGMNNLINLVINKIEQNPKVLEEINNSPNKKEMYNALKSGNVERCQELADNFCASNNMSRDEMLQHSMEFFSK